MTGPRRARSRPGTALRERCDPFAVLGFDRDADLSDDDVRAAWRRVAAATHPDRADGGDPDRFAAAAAAYTELRTRFGRGEARAGLAEPKDPRGVAGTGSARARLAAGEARARAAWHRRRQAGAGAEVGHTLLTSVRAVRLAIRVVAAAGVAAIALLAAGPGPAGPAVTSVWRAVSRRRGRCRRHGPGPTTRPTTIRPSARRAGRRVRSPGDSAQVAPGGGPSLWITS